jgi:CRISPR/Cas system-associated exonuclease Cas4 (RecB family)
MKQKPFASPGEVVSPSIYEKALRDKLKEQFPKDYTEKAKKNFSPSKLGFGSGKCARMWYYRFEGELDQQDTGDHKSKLKRLFGTKYHEIIQGILPENPGWLLEQKVINNDPPIFGYVDLYDEVNNVPVELKNAPSNKFNSAKDTNVGDESHVIQLLIYMKLKKATQGVLFYIDRTTLDTHAFSVIMTEFHEAYIDGLFRWMQKVRSAFLAGTKPTRLEGATEKSFPCTFCSFQKTCWADPEEGTVTIMKAKDLKYN